VAMVVALGADLAQPRFELFGRQQRLAHSLNSIPS
jgi:hypothetical protein